MKQELVTAGKRILIDTLNLEGPSVRDPNIEETDWGCCMKAGNAVLHLYDFSLDDQVKQKWKADFEHSKQLGSSYGNHITENVYFLDNKLIGWYFTANTNWQ